MQGTDILQNQQCWFKCEFKKKNEAGNVALATEYCLSNLKQIPIKGRPHGSHWKTSSDHHCYK